MTMQDDRDQAMYTNVILEEMRAQFRASGEQVESLGTKLDSLETKVGSLETKVGSLETKVGSIEAEMRLGFRVVEGRLARIETHLGLNGSPPPGRKRTPRKR